MLAGSIVLEVNMQRHQSTENHQVLLGDKGEANIMTKEI